MTYASATGSGEVKTPAEHVIEKLGGLTKMARALGCAVSTVQGWKERGKIPQDHWLPILNIAQSEGVRLNFEDFVIAPAATPAEHGAAA